eukprot:5190216-Prymnesium_polylepis.2
MGAVVRRWARAGGMCVDAAGREGGWMDGGGCAAGCSTHLDASAGARFIGKHDVDGLRRQRDGEEQSLARLQVGRDRHVRRLPDRRIDGHGLALGRARRHSAVHELRGALCTRHATQAHATLRSPQTGWGR